MTKPRYIRKLDLKKRMAKVVASKEKVIKRQLAVDIGVAEVTFNEFMYGGCNTRTETLDKIEQWLDKEEK